CSSLIAASGRRVESHFGEKPLSVWIGRGDLRQLTEVDLTGFGVLIQPLQMWFIPPAYKVEFGWPACGASTHYLQRVGKGRPIFDAGFGPLEIKECLHRLVGFGQTIQQTCGRCRTSTRKELNDAKTGYPITQILCPTQKRKDVLNMCGLEKLKAAK